MSFRQRLRRLEQSARHHQPLAAWIGDEGGTAKHEASPQAVLGFMQDVWGTQDLPPEAFVVGEDEPNDFRVLIERARQYEERMRYHRADAAYRERTP